MNINNVTLGGRLTRDPELRFTASGLAQCTFSIAQNNRCKEGNEWVDGDTYFFDAVCWRALAENTAELQKGDLIVIVGRLQQRSWETDSGERRSKIEIVAEDVTLSRKWAAKEASRTTPDYGPGEEPF